MTLLSILLQAPAAAPAAAPKGGMDFTMILLMVGVFAIMWLFMIRPQQKRQKELMNFRKSLQAGDKVITAGGIYGTIKEIKETYILLEVDRNTDIRVDKSMIMKDTSDIQQR
jgi:preprotein translocase subunit YajC